MEAVIVTIARRKKKFVRLFAVTVFLLLVLYLGFLWMGWHGATIRYHLQLIHNGMTLDEVKAIWGDPIEIRTHTVDCQEGYWYAWDGMLVVAFINGHVAEVKGFPNDPLPWLWTRIQLKLGIH